MADIQGLVTFQGVPVNAVVCDLWPSSATFLTYPPQMDTAEPIGVPQATVLTGEANGGDGAYLFTAVPPGEWWVAQQVQGHILWDYFNLARRGGVIVLCAGFTPTGTGADIAEVEVPFDPADGVTSITWNVRRIWLRVNVAGGAPVAVIEKSVVAGAFSPVTVGTLTMGNGAYEVAVTAALGTVASGNKLRFNVSTLATATGWSIGCEVGQ